MSDGSRHALYAVEETVYGTTPASPALDKFRNTSMTIGLSRDELPSEEIRSDRQMTDFRLGADSVGGDVNFQLSYGSFDNLLEGALMSVPWASDGDTGVVTLSGTVTGYSRVSGSFLADGFEVGQVVVATGFAGAGFNGKSIITAVTALSMDTTIIGTGSHGVEAGSGDEQIVSAQSIKGGVTRKSFSLIRHFEDILPIDKPYYIFAGVEVNTLSLTIAAASRITGTFTLNGRSQSLANDLTGLGTPTFNPEVTTEGMDSFTSSLEEGGTVNECVTEITLNLTHSLENINVVGSRLTKLPSAQDINLTGQLTISFTDSVMVEKFLNETESALTFLTTDTAGNSYRIRVPRLKFTGGQPDVSGKGDITVSLPFQALLDSTTGTNIIIERIPA